jgi:hypothetical protein
MHLVTQTRGEPARDLKHLVTVTRSQTDADDRRTSGRVSLRLTRVTRTGGEAPRDSD